MQRIDVPAHVERIGRRFQQGCLAAARRHDLPLTFSSFPSLSIMRFNHPEHPALMTLFTARMLCHGILAGGSFYPTLAHRDHHIDRFLAVVDEIYAELATAIRVGDAKNRIGGPVKHMNCMRLD